jgi:hypothetical protein
MVNRCGKLQADNKDTVERVAISDPSVARHGPIQESNAHGVVRYPAILAESASAVMTDILREGDFVNGWSIQAGEFQRNSRRSPRFQSSLWGSS